MSDLTIKVLDLIEKKYTVNEMVAELNISRDYLYKIFRELRELGMNFSKRYYSSGDFIYLPNKEIHVPSKNNHVNIITNPGSESFRALFLADLHLGSEFECIDALHKVFDYCIVNNIHTIIIVGDFLDGIKIGRPYSKFHTNPLEQMEYAIKNYPFDKNILNFLLLGNHDIDSLVSFGIDFADYLRNFRHDIVPVGYGNGMINVKNDRILLAHSLCIGISCEHDLSSNFLLAKGHHHTTRSIIGANGNCSLNVPSISRLFFSDNEFLPGAIDLTVTFRGGYFDTIYYEHLLIDNKVHAVNSIQYAVGHARDRSFNGNIKYEEDLNKRKSKKKEKN